MEAFSQVDSRSSRSSRASQFSLRPKAPLQPALPQAQFLAAPASEPQSTDSLSIQGHIQHSALSFITLSRLDYSTSPSIEALNKMSESQKASVNALTVSRRDYGSVQFVVPVDIRRVTHLDKIVEIGHGHVSVYSQGCKPAGGFGLNTAAIVTLLRCFPAERTDYHYRVFERRMNDFAASYGGQTLSYDRITGVWRFCVKHF